jgi:hypothetical protein
MKEDRGSPPYLCPLARLSPEPDFWDYASLYRSTCYLSFKDRSTSFGVIMYICLRSQNMTQTYCKNKHRLGTKMFTNIYVLVYISTYSVQCVWMCV